MNLTQKIAMHVLAIGLTIGGTYYLTDQVINTETALESNLKRLGIECNLEYSRLYCRRGGDKCNEKDCLEQCNKYAHSKYDILGALSFEEKSFCVCIAGLK